MTLDRLTALLAQYDLERLVKTTGDPRYYEPEARRVLDDLPDCRSASDVARVLRRTFDALFASGVPRTTKLERYGALASEVWSEMEVNRCLRK